MLPIDEHAKSGAWVYCTNRARLELQKVRWQSGVWVHASGFGGAPADAYAHYLPASWVEHAGAMREAVRELPDPNDPSLKWDSDFGEAYLDWREKHAPALAPFQQEARAAAEPVEDATVPPQAGK